MIRQGELPALGSNFNVNATTGLLFKNTAVCLIDRILACAFSAT